MQGIPSGPYLLISSFSGRVYAKSFDEHVPCGLGARDQEKLGERYQNSQAGSRENQNYEFARLMYELTRIAVLS